MKKLYWFWFTAKKDGELRREKLPAESKDVAIVELTSLGYSDITFIDCYPFRDYTHTYVTYQ